jgi:hypothetical protein
MCAQFKRVASVEFLLAEIDTGLTFARIAQSADTTSKIERNLKNARKAYDSAVRFRGRVVLDKAQKEKIDANLRQLKTVLEGLGETV